MADHAIFTCQLCKAKLHVTGHFEAGYDLKPGPSSRPGIALHTSALEGSKIDESFIVLADDKRAQAGPSGRGLEESFVVLGSASVLRPPQGAGQGPPGPPSSAGAQQQQQQQERDVGFDAKMQALAQLFELASTHAQVDHPLCLDCAAQLKDEVEAQVHDTEREIAAYSAAVVRLKAAAAEPLSDSDLAAQLAAAEAEVGAERRRAQQLEAELAAVAAEQAGAAAASAELNALEERYWHEHNEYQLLLAAHIEERDGLLAKIDRASHLLQALSHTNVYNDVFKIWHDGPFGTISGFRLGRTPEVHVEWDEINAAWGQAVLLLHTMAQACHLTFAAYRLLPMGSHPRVADKRGAAYDLFGPVSKLWSGNYDRAMMGFLTCLKEFGEHATRRDVGERRSPAFEFPFPIDGDKVGSQTIKLTLNKDAKWTKALKFMLADLKVALQWLVRAEQAAELPALQQLGQEGHLTAM